MSDGASEGAAYTKRDASSRADMEFGTAADAYRSNLGSRSSRAGSYLVQAVAAAVVLCVALVIANAVSGHIGLFALGISVVLAAAAFSSVHVALDWERYVVLRFGKFNRLGGPGLFFTIPVVEYCTLRIDQRTIITPFGAEETLTSDVVPLDVDAVLSWMVWDPEKACTEVEDYRFAVALAAQTALRDAIGRATATEVITRRNQLDRELREAIEAKVGQWGVTVLSVEIRDIIIPTALQDTMSLEAQAERRRAARMTLMESEHDIAELLSSASDIYKNDDIAYELRKLHLLHEGVISGDEALVVPSQYSEGFAAPSDAKK